MPRRTALLVAWLLTLAVPAAAQHPLRGHWEGAMVRDGAVRLLSLGVEGVGDSLVARIASADLFENWPEPVRITHTGDGVALEIPRVGRAQLQLDTVLLELRGSVGSVHPPVTVHLKRVPPPAPAVALVREEVEARSGGITISGTLVRPATPGPHPVLVWLHGRGQYERDVGPLHEYFARYGYAFFLYDKRGSGRTGGERDAATVHDLIGDAAAVVRRLAEHPSVDPQRVGLVAYSAGGWVAPRVAGMAPVAFVITVAGPAESVHDQQVHAYEHILRASDVGYSEAEIAQAREYIRLRMSAALRGQRRAEYARRTERMRRTRMAPILVAEPAVRLA